MSRRAIADAAKGRGHTVPHAPVAKVLDIDGEDLA